MKPTPTPILPPEPNASAVVGMIIMLFYGFLLGLGLGWWLWG